MKLYRRALPIFLSWLMVACSSTSSYVKIDPEDQRLIDAASCSELLEEYPDYLAAETELAASLKSATQTQVATNLIGAATLATLGLGLFNLDDYSDARDALAELRDIRIALDTAIKIRGCKQSVQR